jgi:hypothetical protein
MSSIYPGAFANLSTVSSGAVVTSAGQNGIVNEVNGIESGVGLNPARAYAEGRLTLTTGVPVTTSDVTGATTIYFTALDGFRIGLYDGTINWNVIVPNADLSLALGTLVNNTNYDIFI